MANAPATFQIATVVAADLRAHRGRPAMRQQYLTMRADNPAHRVAQFAGIMGHSTRSSHSKPSGIRKIPVSAAMLDMYEVGYFETSDNVRLRYYVRGNGPPVLTCQGSPANISDTLADALAPFDDAYTLVYHDYRGSGRSAIAPTTTYIYERIADDLE